MKKLLLCTFFAFLFFSLVAQAQEFSITIDGEKDAFYSTLTGPDDGYIFMPYESFTTDLGTQPSSNDDVSGFVWFAWDEDFLYCYLEVTDDTMMVIDQDRWYNDGIEIKFDPDPSAGTGSGTSNLRLTALGYGDADSNGVDNLNRSGHLEDASGNDLVVAESDFARRVTSDGYALEFRVPFDYINEMEDDRYMVSREEGNVFGMAINIIDNDSGSRDHMLQWSAGVVDAAHSDAAYHGSVTFLSGNKLKLDASVSPRTDTV
ncbi:MAG: sugar-binding protein, partial [Ignavibacteria bacterium]